MEAERAATSGGACTSRTVRPTISDGHQISQLSSSSCQEQLPYLRLGQKMVGSGRNIPQQPCSPRRRNLLRSPSSDRRLLRGWWRWVPGMMGFQIYGASPANLAGKMETQTVEKHSRRRHFRAGFRKFPVTIGPKAGREWKRGRRRMC